MLRPRNLVEAEQEHREGKLDRHGLQAVHDQAVDEALRIPGAACVDLASDGDMRRDRSIAASEGLPSGQAGPCTFATRRAKGADV